MHCQLHPFLGLLFPRPADEQGFAKPPLPHPSPAAFLSHKLHHRVGRWELLGLFDRLHTDIPQWRRGRQRLRGFSGCYMGWAYWVSISSSSFCLVSRQAAVYSSGSFFLFVIIITSIVDDHGR
ncbi:hypothetical protein BKA80DRAFT_273241 [Phyllosticta citrichinensis]